jgi:hypothetical protein
MLNIFKQTMIAALVMSLMMGGAMLLHETTTAATIDTETKFTFEQVAVSTNQLIVPPQLAGQYQVMVAYVLDKKLSGSHDGVVTCSLFAKGKLIGTATGYGKIHGSAGPVIEKVEPDSAQCSVQITFTN